MNQYRHGMINETPYFMPISFIFTYSFSVPESQPGYHITSRCWIFLTVTVPQTLLALMTLTVLRYAGQVFCRLEICLLFLSWLDWGYRLGRKTSEVRCCFHPVLSKVHTINMAYHGWYPDLDLPGRDPLWSYSLPPLFPHCTFEKEVTTQSPHLRRRELCCLPSG